MTKTIIGSSWIWKSMCLIVFAKGQTTVTRFDAISNQTNQTEVNNSSEPMGNNTKEFKELSGNIPCQ